MLTLLNALQLVLYIALWALLGQGVLYLLAGATRDRNFFYRVLQALGRPFMAATRRLMPRSLPDAAVACITFGLMVALYAWVTFERADWCVSHRLLASSG